MDRRILSSYLRISRAVAMYLTFAFLVGIASFSFVATSQNIESDSVWVIDVIKTLMIPLVFGSITRVFAQHDQVMHTLLHDPSVETDEELPFREGVRRVLHCKEFLLEAAILVGLCLLLPLELTFGAPAALLGGMARPLKKLLIVLILGPVLFFLELWHNVRSLYLWIDMQRARTKEGIRKRFWRDYLLVLVGYALAYAVLTPVLALFMTLVFAIRNIQAAALMLLAIVGVALMPVALVLAVKYLRAFRIRRRFIKALKRRCEEQSFTLSPIRRPYRSLFRLADGADFTVHAHGKVYSCKMVKAISYSAPLIFSPDGTVYAVHSFSLKLRPMRYRHAAGALNLGLESQTRAHVNPMKLEFFSFTTKTDYTFEGERIKVIIVNPVSDVIEVGDPYRSQIVDSGDRIGAYKLFAGTAFLNAIERDVVER